MYRLRAASAAAIFFALAGSALALGVEQTIADPAQEARARGLFHEIRCVVCAGESVADSPASVAEAMRNEIRSLVNNGTPDEDIRNMLV